MLHGLKLPEITEQRLTEIVEVQMAFLSCAVTAVNLETSPVSFDREKFAQQLDQQANYAGRGEKLTNWVIEGKRSEWLNTFATSYCSEGLEERRAEQVLKKDWCEKRRKEVRDLLARDLAYLEVDDFFAMECIAGRMCPEVKRWKEAAGNFLLSFYKAYLEGDTTFPQVLFAIDKTIFGRQQLLYAFREENKELEICAACDQGRYYDTNKSRIYAELDHYLPKFRYPHFACHPYNLIPVCHNCNASQKGTEDPFPAGHPRRLSRHSLPYRGNLREAVYLSVDLSGLETVVHPNELDEPKKVIKLGKLRPRSDNTAIPQAELEEAIAILERLYHIPGRWASPEQSNRIRGTLFRRMRQFMNAVKRAPLEVDISSEIYNYLHILLYYLAHEDQQKDPFAFAMTWMLVALINEYRKDRANVDATSSEQENWSDPLFEELLSWYERELDPELNTKRIVDARKLLEIPGKGTVRREQREDK